MQKSDKKIVKKAAMKNCKTKNYINYIKGKYIKF